MSEQTSIAVIQEMEINRLRKECDRLRDENGRMKALLFETQSQSFPHVPAWFSIVVDRILQGEAGDE